MAQKPSFFTDSMASIVLSQPKMHFLSRIRLKTRFLSLIRTGGNLGKVIIPIDFD